MTSINDAITGMNMKKQIDKCCKVRTYLPIKEKYSFCEDFKKLITEHQNDFPGMQSYVSFVIFEFLFVKNYTDISIEFSYEEYDKLYKSGIIKQLANMLDDEYKMLFAIVTKYMNG